jgi:hypothetical protein
VTFNVSWQGKPLKYCTRKEIAACVRQVRAAREGMSLDQVNMDFLACETAVRVEMRARQIEKQSAKMFPPARLNEAQAGR